MVCVLTSVVVATEVLTLLVEHRLHRLYVVTAELQPVGLITLSNVLRKVCEEDGTPAPRLSSKDGDKAAPES